jgi:hypothetical protein
VTEHGYGDAKGTKYTGCPMGGGGGGGVGGGGQCPMARGDGKAGLGQTHGGMSWTKKWLNFDNSYFKKAGLNGLPLVYCRAVRTTLVYCVKPSLRFRKRRV